jgi:hypothetical protein
VRKFDVKLGVFVLFRSKRRESQLTEGKQSLWTWTLLCQQTKKETKVTWAPVDQARTSNLTNSAAGKTR